MSKKQKALQAGGANRTELMKARNGNDTAPSTESQEQIKTLVSLQRGERARLALEMQHHNGIWIPCLTSYLDGKAQKRMVIFAYEAKPLAAELNRIAAVFQIQSDV